MRSFFGLHENIINSETKHDRGEVTIEHKKELVVNFSGTIVKLCVRRPLPEISPLHHDVISGLQENMIISETMHDRGEVTVEHK